jgi:hypothetical protein
VAVATVPPLPPVVRGPAQAAPGVREAPGYPAAVPADLEPLTAVRLVLTAVPLVLTAVRPVLEPLTAVPLVLTAVRPALAEAAVLLAPTAVLLVRAVPALTAVLLVPRIPAPTAVPQVPRIPGLMAAQGIPEGAAVLVAPWGRIIT